MLALRPPNTRTPDHFHVYYLKRFLANGVYIGPGGMFVKDMAKLLESRKWNRKTDPTRHIARTWPCVNVKSSPGSYQSHGQWHEWLDLE